MTTLHAAAALLLIAAAPVGAADDQLDYNTLIDCAAYNELLIVVFSADDGAVRNSAEIEDFTQQAAALMTFASFSDETSIDKVETDALTKRDQMLGVLSGEGGADQLLDTYSERCTVMGRTARQALKEVTAK